jgi:exopolysaccharide biosynthesis WecB/TagA/CpsF family protein
LRLRQGCGSIASRQDGAHEVMSQEWAGTVPTKVTATDLRLDASAPHRWSIANWAPDLVVVGLGFPRQERLIERLRHELPGAWCLACGRGIAMTAGVVRRSSPLIQRLGFEWLHRPAL